MIVTRDLPFLMNMSSAYREGVRRSTREHIKPLEWWRGERYVYGRDRSTTPGPVYVAPIKEIMRIPKEPAIPLGSKRKRSSGRARSKSRMVEQPPVGYNPEEGWDDNTSDIGVILEYPGGEDKERREQIQSVFSKSSTSDIEQGLRLLQACLTRSSLPTTNGHIKRSLVMAISLRRGN